MKRRHVVFHIPFLIKGETFAVNVFNTSGRGVLYATAEVSCELDNNYVYSSNSLYANTNCYLNAYLMIYSN